MQWSTLLAVVIGTVVGGLSTALADHLHWRRSVVEQDRENLRKVYVEFLDAAAQTASAISDTAHDLGSPVEARAKAARKAVNQLGLYANQFHVELSAPNPVLPLADQVIGAVLTLRNAVEEGSIPGSQPYERAWEKIHEARRVLREAMRDTISRGRSG
ncbi:hypothetical protein ABT300_31435 [Streptomyces sp. NPDC001027]|uniref:hypothetical protein n=1 Tax=Streptomyces sp. NPDC001027 TaxID=3154771 RepID=UPI00331EFA95